MCEELAKAQKKKAKKKIIKAPEHIFKPSQQEIVHILLLNRIYIRYIIKYSLYAQRTVRQLCVLYNSISIYT